LRGDYSLPNALHPFHRLVNTNAQLFPVRRTEIFEAPANSFYRLLRDSRKAVLLGPSKATDLAVPIGHEDGLADYLDQFTLVAAKENDAVDPDRSSRMSELPNRFRLPLFPDDNLRAADTSFLRERGPLPTEWSAGFLCAPRNFDLSRWLSPVPD